MPLIGPGILLRILIRVGGKTSARKGFVPRRWYLQEALTALSSDDLLGVIRHLRPGQKGKNRERWELIRQQAIFRCRILKEGHALTLRRLERFRSARGQTGIHDRSLAELILLHQRGIEILTRHEASLISLPSKARLALASQNQALVPDQSGSGTINF